jgi:16S rRNA processing protein RimM
MIRKEELFQIGQFAKPHGIKGEIALVTTYDVFDDVEEPYLVCEMDGILVPFYIENCRPKGNSVILVKLENINDEASIRAFANKAVYYPLTALKEDSDEEFTWTHFIGYTLEGEEQGRIGVVTDVDDSTLNILFSVESYGKELLIPVAERLICSIDQENRILTVSLPEGILDL